MKLMVACFLSWPFMSEMLVDWDDERPNTLMSAIAGSSGLGTESMSSPWTVSTSWNCSPTPTLVRSTEAENWISPAAAVAVHAHVAARTMSTAASHLGRAPRARSEEHTSELQSQSNLVCRLL